MAGKYRAKGRRWSPKLIARREATALKDGKALELRKAGGKYEDIAVECGYATKQAAYRAVQRALESITQEPAAELLTLYQSRLDRMYLGLVKNGAHDGDPKAVLAAVRVLETHARLSGHLRNDSAPAETGPAIQINISPLAAMAFAPPPVEPEMALLAQVSGESDPGLNG
jgi:hypothetical protein